MTRAEASAAPEPATAPSLPEGARLVEGSRGTTLQLSGAWGSGAIALRGAQLTDWTPAGQRPVLWMSALSHTAPLRGGVPVCFPWFAVHPRHPEATKHGFARTSLWELGAVHAGDAEASVTLRLRDSEHTRATVWPHRFEAEYTITLGASLTLSLAVTNRDEGAIEYEAALHNYYAVTDAAAASITGLEGLPFTGLPEDQPEPAPEPVRLRGEQTSLGIDRTYPVGADAAVLHDLSADPVEAGGRSIRIETEGSGSIIVWNPGAYGAAGIGDMADDDWQRMFCVETGTVRAGAVRLAPGATHRQGVRVTVTP